MKFTEPKSEIKRKSKVEEKKGGKQENRKLTF